ncbi:MAG: hypothetical protein IKJ35_07645 [Clostridia bacterium]|nr:hypothetical protein [Clostridia bacterium]
MERGTTVGAEKIVALFDAGTFVETGAFMQRANGDLTGVVCGYGAIDGKLVYAFSQDSDRKKGAFDAIQAEKIAMLYRMAMKNGAPVIGMFDSAGAVVCDGASAMSAYGKLLKAVSDASGVIPQIAIVSGVCMGMSATVASMFDVIVTVKEKALLSVNAPFVVGKAVGSSEAVAADGLSALEAENDDDAMQKAAKLISMLPANNAEGVIVEELNDDINRKLSADGLVGKALVEAIADAGDFVELGAAYAGEILTGLIRLGGVTCGVIASNPEVSDGTVTADAAKKAARMISFCDSFSIPVLTLTDSIGVEIGKDAESAPLAAQLGKLAMAYATADTAKITVVTGKAYGAAFTLLGSKALGADMVYALEEAEISVMAPASAVAFLWNDRITEDCTRADLEAEWKEKHASAQVAASDGSIDDVINAAELRQRICAAVYMLLMKNDGSPARKHCNLPL